MMTIKSIEVEHLTNIHTTLSEKDIEWMKRNEEVWLYYQEATLEEIMLLEENTDDLWNVYNLLQPGDFVFGTCHRKI